LWFGARLTLSGAGSFVRRMQVPVSGAGLFVRRMQVRWRSRTVTG
jgi:hypothetical protein